MQGVELWPTRALNQLYDLGVWSGGERTRTADFYVANVALYQLSYTPVLIRKGGPGPAKRY